VNAWLLSDTTVQESVARDSAGGVGRSGVSPGAVAGDELDRGSGSDDGFGVEGLSDLSGGEEYSDWELTQPLDTQFTQSEGDGGGEGGGDGGGGALEDSGSPLEITVPVIVDEKKVLPYCPSFRCRHYLLLAPLHTHCI
jgi:hypothetical protein